MQVIVFPAFFPSFVVLEAIVSATATSPPCVWADLLPLHYTVDNYLTNTAVLLLKPHAQLIGFPGHYLRHGMAAEQADIKIALTNTDEYI